MVCVTVVPMYFFSSLKIMEGKPHIHLRYFYDSAAAELHAVNEQWYLHLNKDMLDFLWNWLEAMRKKKITCAEYHKHSFFGNTVVFLRGGGILPPGLLRTSANAGQRKECAGLFVHLITWPASWETTPISLAVGRELVGTLRLRLLNSESVTTVVSRGPCNSMMKDERWLKAACMQVLPSAVPLAPVLPIVLPRLL